MERSTTQQDFWERNRLTIKGITIGFLIIVLLIPTVFIQNLVRERKLRQQQVINEVSGKWAGAQTIQGPFLVIPYQEFTKDDKGKLNIIRHTAYFLPENLNITGALLPEIRYRSIYKIVVYKSDLSITGNFSPLNFSELNINPSTILWNEARVCLGLNDTRGIEDQIKFKWNGGDIPFDAGMPANTLTGSGVNATIKFEKDSSQVNQFFIQLKLKGSEKLFFTPLGKQTMVSIQSPWTNPAFDGNFLPGKRIVNEKGFTADWNILHYNRNIPQSWTDGDYETGNSAFGINLLQGTDSYSQTMRSVKYAILFIALTFAVFFFLEILQKRSVHPLQYILVGLALCVFYTLLLSFSEYMLFNISYLIAAAATIMLITLYSKSLFLKWSIAGLFGLFLSLLYSFIFILIRLQDGALLFGSIGLFLLLAAVMYYSRKIDWFGKNLQTERELAG